MSKQEWQQVYADAWKRYYSDAHVETIMRRAIVAGINKKKILNALTIFSGASRIEGVHPLQFGIFRRKVRNQRRYGMPIVNPLLFYPWRAFDWLKVVAQWLLLIRSYRRMMARIAADPGAQGYMDEALLVPGEQGEPDHLVEAFADKIPKTHGAPVRAPAMAG